MEMLHDALKLPFQFFLETAQHNEFMYILIALIAAFGILGQWVLYYKCDLPGIASIVPFWNVITFLKIMGRPAWQVIFFIVPPPVIIYIVYTGDTSMAANVTLVTMLAVFVLFSVMLYIELCKCFGKNSFVDYILVLVFNGLYVMYLGMSGDTEYFGPLYGKNKQSNQVESKTA